MANYKVNILNAEYTKLYSSERGYSTWNSWTKFIGLGIYGKKSAYLLAKTILSKWGSAHRGNYGQSIGGGMIVGCNCDVAIDCYGEVGILFKNYNNLSRYIRIARGQAEKIKSIKDKIANDLKSFWKSINVSEDINIIHINGLSHNECEKSSENDKEMKFTISYDEYRTLYEVLKGRNIKKIQNKYGTKNYDEMIGKKLENQFAINAIIMIQNEISKLIEERDVKKKLLEETYRREERNLRDKHQKEIEKNWNNYQTKIGQLESQVLTMMEITVH